MGEVARDFPLAIDAQFRCEADPPWLRDATNYDWFRGHTMRLTVRDAALRRFADELRGMLGL